MGSLALFSALIFISGSFQDATEAKPQMFPDKETLSVYPGDEIRIECYSKGVNLQFSVPEAEVTNIRSNHKILQFGNGTYTFFRGPAVRNDAGWYACAEEGIEIDNHFSNINHTHADISWIYVYVQYGHEEFFTNRNFRIYPKTIIGFEGSTVVVPCRPTSPSPYSLGFLQNFKPLLTDGTAVRFDPKIGFIMKAVDLKNGEAVFQCGLLFDGDDYVLRMSRQRPTMITAGSELTVQEGTELRIECHSETKLSFLFPERFSNSSKYEIFANKSGVNTFLRRSAVADDTGWYGCAGEGIRNDIPYQSINYTKKEISWIYVYVNSTIRMTSGLLVYVSYLRNYAIIPCRPTSPGLHVQLFTWRNSSIPEHVKNVPFDPKLGFVIRKLHSYGDLFTCTTNETIHYFSETYNLTSAVEYARNYKEATIVDVDDPSATKASSVRITGEDLRLLCKVVAPEVAFYRLEWKIPPALSKDRVQYRETRAYELVNNSVYLEAKTSMMTIKNISKTDSGEYICSVRKFKYASVGTDVTAEISRHVEVFDKHSGRYMKFGKQPGSMHVTGLKGGTVRWLLDHGNSPSANISWCVSPVTNWSKYLELSSDGIRGPDCRQHANRKINVITDNGFYELSTRNGDMSMRVYFWLRVQEPPLASIQTLHRHTLPTEELITVSCWSAGIPRPDVTFSFLNLPKFPSHASSKLGDFLGMDGINTRGFHFIDHDEYRESRNVQLIINMSGVLTCVACNPVNCSKDEKQILYSASDKPYFTSTNLNHSNGTRSLEINKNITTVLECYAAGRPYPRVTWFKDNILLQEDKQFKFAYDNRELSIIFFVDGDSGRYMCRAENEHGKVEDYVDITIEGKPDVWRTNLIIAASMLLGVTLISWVAIGKLRIELTRKKSIDSAFKNGDLDRLNPELPIVEQAELLPYDMKWEFPRELLTLDKILGSGAFGIVKKAQAKSIRRGEAVTTVAVKMVRSKASLNFITALTRELKILVYLGKHINVVNLLGACTKNVSYGELFVIVEYCHFGNLRDYLLRGRADFIDPTRSKTGETFTSSVDADQVDITDETPNSNGGNFTEPRDQDTDSTSTCMVDENRTSGEDSGDAQGLRSNYRGDCEDMNLEPVCTRDLVYWSWQVSRGMDYLGKRKVVHGDLAARNILLAEKGIVKISDFGLSKALYEEAQYRDRGVDPLPVKWMAIESIKDRVFSYQSDIWSFGIVMWEFFILAKKPYPGIKCRELYQRLINGYRMEKPEFATSTLYDTMLDCWESEPSKRPSFIKLAHRLGDLLDEGVKSHYLDMIASYIEINADMFENGCNDYLTLSPSTFDAAASGTVHEQIEMDGLPHDESTSSM